MVWYYAEGDRQKGPISDEEFQELVNNGRVNNETLVWQDGMDNWQPLESAREAGLAVTSPALPPLPGSAFTPLSAEPDPSNISTDSSDASPAKSGSVCAQCGRGPLSGHDGVQLGNLCLCRNCDGDLARHYQSGAPPSSAYPAWPAGSGPAPVYGPTVTGAAIMPYASLFSRAAAKIVDNLLQSGVSMVIVAATIGFEVVAELGPSLGDSREQILLDLQRLLLAIRPYMLGALIFRVLYDSVLVAKFGATLGKMALGLGVAAEDGSQVSFRQAITRAIVPAVLQLPGLMVPGSTFALLAQMIFWFGYFIALFDAQKRTLYDHIAGTRVVKP